MHWRPRIAAFLAVMAFAASARSHAAGAASTRPAAATPAPIGPDAVWTPPEGFRERVNAACSKAGVHFSDCFAAEMKKAGASKDALAFTRRTGNQGYLTAFVEAGRVDVAYAEYPFRANENSLVFLVNGEPPLIDVDDPSASGLEAAKLEGNSTYVALKKRYPRLAFFPAARTPPRGAQPTPTRDGGPRINVLYELHDGCHACRTVGLARVVFKFDGQGRFTGTRVLQIRSVVTR